MADLRDKIRRAERALFHTQTVAEAHNAQALIGAALSQAFSSQPP